MGFFKQMFETDCFVFIDPGLLGIVYSNNDCGHDM
jgi:hypothetical protein